jgi:hypothetical protein
MKSLGFNRVLVVVGFAAALGIWPRNCPAGNLQIVRSIDFPLSGEWMGDLAWDGDSLLFATNSGLGAHIYARVPLLACPAVPCGRANRLR